MQELQVNYQLLLISFYRVFISYQNSVENNFGVAHGNLRSVFFMENGRQSK